MSRPSRQPRPSGPRATGPVSSNPGSTRAPVPEVGGQIFCPQYLQFSKCNLNFFLKVQQITGGIGQLLRSGIVIMLIVVMLLILNFVCINNLFIAFLS